MARPAVTLQAQAGGAGAGGPARVGQTQVAAAPVVLAAAVDVGLHAVDLHGMDVHHPGQLGPDDRHVGPRVLVGSLNGAGLRQTQTSVRDM